MKKYFGIMLIAALALFTSCSSGDDSSSVQPDVATMSVGELNYDINTSDQVYCVREGERFYISIANFQFDFNPQGDLGTAETLHADQGVVFTYRSRFFNSSATVSLEIESIDAVNKRIKGHVSGTLFNTNAQAVLQELPFSCDFNFAYYDRIPMVQGIRNSARIDGQPWYFTNLKKEFSISYTSTITYVSDDANSIIFTCKLTEIAAGQYNFDPGTTVNKLQYARYDEATHQNIIYNTTGTFNISKRETIDSSTFILTGTYDFTAVNPNNPADVVHVTDGQFKQIIYNW